MLALALDGAEDPSRPRGRILNRDAGLRALQRLRASAPARYRDYEVVHVASSSGRWIVLLDRVPHTGLKEAVVVELRQTDGAVVAVRPIEGFED